MNKYILAFDVGGTRLKVGIVDLNGNLLDSFLVPSRANEGAPVLLKTIIDYIHHAQKSYEGELIGIGLSLSGVVDQQKGVVLLPGKFKALEDFEIIAAIKNEFDLPVFADNDGRLAAYAEKYFGVAKNVDWAVVLTIGTGIGSGVIIDGKILTNKFLQFGIQIGHLIMNSSSELLCLTGNYGTGEAICSATALTLQVRGAIQRGLPSMLSDEYFEVPFNIDFKRIAEACREGDELCLREMKIWRENLAILIINAVHSYSPEKIILGGGATLAADLFLSEVKRIVNEKCFRYPVKETIKIEISNIQEYASVLGAAAIVMKNLKIL